MLLTRSPLIPTRKRFTVRLACVKHAASVRPEPGSNSPLMFKPPHPQKGARKNKPRRVTDSSQTEQSQTDSILSNQTKTRTMSQPKKPTHKTRSNLASIFGTLLSSQESHAHPHTAITTTHRGNRSNLPDPLRRVKPAPIRRSEVVQRGLAYGAGDDFSIDLRPPLTTRTRPVASSARPWLRPAARPFGDR